MDDQNKEEEKVTIRHTINAEETFTLAKDVYDIRNLLKNIYNNRAVIARRLNIFSLTVSLLFTALYVAYILCTGILKKISLHTELALYILLGVYGALLILMVIITVFSLKAKAKNIKKYTKLLSVFRYVLRLVSLIITIIALVFATGGGEYSANSIALNIVLIIFSIVCLIVQLIPLIFGSLGKLARWLLSPVKIKRRFSAVALEWYELTVSNSGESKAVKRVSQKFFSEIGICLDNFLIPLLGKKYVNTIKATQILSVAGSASEEERPLVEGILKNIFEYATECGYVTFNPCRDLNFEGSIDEEQKAPKKTVKNKLFGIGKKWGMSLLDKYIEKSAETDDK